MVQKLTTGRYAEHRTDPYQGGLVVAAKNGHFRVVSYLIESPRLKSHCSAINNDALKQAAKNNHAKIVAYLFYKRKELENEGYFESAKHPQKIASLAANETNAEAVIDLLKLIDACERDDVEEVKKLSISPNPKDPLLALWLPLNWSCSHGQVRTSKFIIDSWGGPENIPNRLADNILESACSKNHMAMVKYLISAFDEQKNPDVLRTKTIGLCRAIANENPEIAQVILGSTNGLTLKYLGEILDEPFLGIQKYHRDDLLRMVKEKEENDRLLMEVRKAAFSAATPKRLAMKAV